MPHSQSALDETAAKPQRVGLIAARSKVEAQELSADVSRALDAADRVERARPAATAYACLDLAEHEAAAARGDDVELAVARPVVALDDAVAGPLQVLGRETLAEGSECTPGI